MSALAPHSHVEQASPVPPADELAAYIDGELVAYFGLGALFRKKPKGVG